VRVLTYNVLSSSLCEADYHVKCKAQGEHVFSSTNYCYVTLFCSTNYYSCGYHVKCNAQDLDERTRLRRVCDLLAPEVASGISLCV
jgi:hypothetical protein